MVRRLREMLDGITGTSLPGGRVLPAVLGVLALVIFAWVLTGAFSGGADSERAASRSQLAQGTPSNSSPSGGTEAPVPQSEIKNVDSYAAYTNKDPFALRNGLKPASAGGTSGTSGGSSSTSTNTTSSTNTTDGNGNSNTTNGASSTNSTQSTNGDTTITTASGSGSKQTAAARKRAVRQRAAKMRRAARIQARRQARAQAAQNNSGNGPTNSGGRLPNTGGMLSGGYK